MAPAVPKRLLVSLLLAFFAGWLCYGYLTLSGGGSGDFQWPIRAAQDLLTHHNPYDHPVDPMIMPYPLPAAFFGLPFVHLRPELSAGIFFGFTTFLLALGLTRTSWVPLVTLLSYPYWAALITAQWTPLMMACACFPVLLPCTVVKPQIGLPVGLTHLTRRGILLSLVVVTVSLVLLPSWPTQWLKGARLVAETTAYSPYLPLLVGVGPVLLIALLWRHDPDALFLLLMALSPQRFFYDQLPLWLIPKRRPEFVATMFLSWGALAYRFFTDNPTAMQAGAWSTLWIYMPMLMILVTRRLTLRWESSFVLDGAYTDGGSGGRGICPVPANSGR